MGYYRLGGDLPLKKGEYRPWAKSHKDKHICLCGCGQAIVIMQQHTTRGIPQCINGHYSRIKNAMKGKSRGLNPNWRGGRRINADGYILIIDPGHNSGG